MSRAVHVFHLNPSSVKHRNPSFYALIFSLGIRVQGVVIIMFRGAQQHADTFHWLLGGFLRYRPP